MFSIRIALLLLLLAGLVLLLSQNWFPVLSLVFLGVRSQPLPLAIWISLGVAAGGLTSLSIAGLFKLSNYSAVRHSRRRGRAPQSVPPRGTAPTSNPSPQVDPVTSSEDSDWNFNPNADDEDWGLNEQVEAERTAPQNVRDTAYEFKQEPKSSYRSGSVYSYGYREPKGSGAGRTESVYDADYRVIVPPYQDNPVRDEDEDWGFEDEDFESDEKDSPER